LPKRNGPSAGDAEAVGVVIVTPVGGDWRGQITAVRRPGSPRISDISSRTIELPVY
jgi:hypothetical protein